MCALKADRNEARTDISFFMTDVAERGIIVCHSTFGSGAAMDQALALVAIPSTAAGSSTVSGTNPAGLLLTDVVNIDLTRQHYNWHQDQVQSGGKVTLLRGGYVVTNKVSGTPSGGLPAYYNMLGQLTETVVANGTKVGRFLSKKDADGYAKVEINITG